MNITTIPAMTLAVLAFLTFHLLAAVFMLACLAVALILAPARWCRSSWERARSRPAVAMPVPR